MTYTEVINRIAELEPIIEQRSHDLYDTWDFVNKSYNEFDDAWEIFGDEELKELRILYKKDRQLKSYILFDLPEYGTVMSLKDFIDNVNDGGFIDYDGHGRYVKDKKMTDIMIYPSDVKSGYIRKNFDTIIWFNR